MNPQYLLDFDGVLSDSREIACEEINRLRRERFPLLPQVGSTSDLAILFSGPLRTSLRRFGLSDEEGREFFALHSQAMLDRAGEIRPFDTVLELFSDVAFGRCTIITSSYRLAVERILTRSRHYRPAMFRDIVGRESGKSKTRKILDVLGSEQVERSTALHIGDTVSDLFYSREAAVPFCAVGWGYHPIDYLRVFSPEHTARDASELRAVVAQLECNAKY